MSPAPTGWAVGVTVAVCLALLVACGYWTLRALRRDAAPVLVAEPVAAVVGAPAPAAVAAPPRTAGLGARPDAGCHALMSLGMLVMLAAMVIGW